MRPILPAVAAAAFLALPAWSATEAEVDRLIDALDLSAIVDIMAEEGQGHGQDLQRDLLGGVPSARWADMVDRLHDPDRMMATVRERMVGGLAPVDAAPLIDFFESDLGSRIISLEVEARRALMDADIEASAIEKADGMRADGDPRMDVLETYVEANDLVENNVVGALNSNYAFLRGLGAGGAMDGSLTEDEILADIWSQEPEIREDTIEWVYSFLALAYRPLSDAEIAAYTELSLTPEGQALNRALFDAFDAMYGRISEGLGRGAAQVLAGQDI